jgi:predicted transcriptional regulator
MHPNLEELKELVAAELSLEEIMDILGWTNIDLVEALEEQINDSFQNFAKAVQ